jgi:hypothetical protein
MGVTMATDSSRRSNFLSRPIHLPGFWLWLASLLLSQFMVVITVGDSAWSVWLYPIVCVIHGIWLAKLWERHKGQSYASSTSARFADR